MGHVIIFRNLRTGYRHQISCIILGSTYLMFLERFRKKINTQQRISSTMSNILIQYNNNITKEVYAYVHAVKNNLKWN
jgi:predicted nucleotide-binding protein (sugar kinase/HSP70/actin superfamily)